MKVENLIIKGAKLINGNATDTIDHFCINTNDISGKTIFIPLKGKSDGHSYIMKNIDSLSGFICEKNHDDIIKKAISKNKNIIIIEVDNSLKYMQDLARNVREHIDVPVIAITGSYGKTSMREMIYNVLKTELKVLCTEGNYNNHIGMPLTLLNYKNEDVVLLELGTNHAGEIAVLRDICKPTITNITCIGTAHIGNFKRIKNIYKEKTSIIKGCNYFIQNMDDVLLKKIKVKNSIKYGVSFDKITNIIRGKKTRYTININNTKYKITINSDLEYLIGYSLCAIKIGTLLNLNMKNIIKGIAAFEGPKGRREKIINENGIIINDCYNASYETMTSGLTYFYKQKMKNKIVIIGDILELGSLSKKIHKMIAKYIISNNLKFKEIHLVGKNMFYVYKILKKFGYNVFYYEDVTKVSKKILLNKSVYLKASHGTNLEYLIK